MSPLEVAVLQRTAAVLLFGSDGSGRVRRTRRHNSHRTDGQREGQVAEAAEEGDGVRPQPEEGLQRTDSSAAASQIGHRQLRGRQESGAQ